MNPPKGNLSAFLATIERLRVEREERERQESKEREDRKLKKLKPWWLDAAQ